VEDWAIGLGCAEFISDVELYNKASQQAHEALGFEETERVVYYRKRLFPLREQPDGASARTGRIACAANN
jgi:RimJ/RimL family protein N-acetyltransferase